jgi:hypothetical protein
MKNIYPFLILLLPSPFFAIGQINIGPQIGLNLANYDYKTLDGTKIKTDFKPGVRIGGIIDFKLNNAFHIQTGVSYVQNGYKYQDEVTFRVNTIEIPVSFEFQSRSGFFGGVGFFLGVNTGGRLVVNQDNYLLKIGNDTGSNLVPIDNGFHLNVGYQSKNGLFLRVHYLHGLMPLIPFKEGRANATDYNLGITAGYFLFYKPDKKKGATPKHFNSGHIRQSK